MSRGEMQARDSARVTGIAAADALLGRLAAATELSPETHDAMKELLQSERESAFLIMEDLREDKDARREALDELRGEFDAKIVNLLDQDQLAAYRKLRPH